VRAAALPSQPGTFQLRAGEAAVEKPLSRNALYRNLVQRPRLAGKQAALERGQSVGPSEIQRAGLHGKTGATGTFGRTLRTQRRFERAAAEGDVQYVRQLTKRLTDAEHAAMRVVAIEGDAALRNPAAVINRHIRTHRDWARQGFSKDVHQALVRDLGKAKSVLQNPSDRFLRAVGATRALSKHGEKESIARGFLSRETADARRLHAAQEYNPNLTQAPEGSFYFPLGINKTKGGLGRIFSPRPGGAGIGEPQPGRYAPELGRGRRFTGKSLRKGLIPQHHSRAVMESYQRRLTLHSAHDLYDTLQKASTPTRETATQVPIRATAAISQELKDLLAAADEHIDLSDEARHVFSDKLKALGDKMIVKEGESLKGVRWVEKGFVKDLAGSPSGNVFAQAADAITLPMRAGTLYLRPAYILNALGNVGMMAPEGPMGAPAMWHAARSVQHYGLQHTAWIDSLMEQGRSVAQAAGTRFLHQVPEKMAHVWNYATDLHARRAAFLLEARRAGFKSEEDFNRLRTDPQLAAKRNEVTERARAVIGDYGNLAPTEANVIRRLIYFSPWLKVAARWTGHQLTEHPIQSAIYAQNGRVEAAHVRKLLGLLPEWAYLSGLIPLGHGKTVNPSSVNTPTSVVQAAADLYGMTRAGIGLKQKGSAGLADLLTPAGEAFATAAGQSSDTGQPTGLLGLLESLPQAQAARRGGVWGKPSKTYPETGVGPAVGPLTAGGLYPRETSKAALQKQAEKEGKLSTVEQSYLNVMEKAHHAGLSHVPHEVMREAGMDMELKRQLAKVPKKNGRMDYIVAAGIVAHLYDKLHPGSNVLATLPHLKNEGEAEGFYHAVRHDLFPAYTQWDAYAQHLIDQQFALSH
jgi:uncharacterized protein YfiM (DUF2279 family)